jgi:hypothetical protein
MPMFSYEVLTQFIRFYGQAMQGMMGPSWKRTCNCLVRCSRNCRSRPVPCTVTRRCSTPPCGVSS